MSSCFSFFTRTATTPRYRAPVKTWNMCKPVIAKKVAPNNGVGGVPSVVVNTLAQCSGRKNGRSPSLIKWFHSIMCSTTKDRPSRIVATIHFRAAALSPRADAETPKTIVKLDDNKQNVITEEKTMLG